MAYLVLQTLILVLTSAVGGAALAYWWFRRGFEDVTEEHERLRAGAIPAGLDLGPVVDAVKALPAPRMDLAPVVSALDRLTERVSELEARLPTSPPAPGSAPEPLVPVVDPEGLEGDDEGAAANEESARATDRDEPAPAETGPTAEDERGATEEPPAAPPTPNELEAEEATPAEAPPPPSDVHEPTERLPTEAAPPTPDELEAIGVPPTRDDARARGGAAPIGADELELHRSSEGANLLTTAAFGPPDDLERIHGIGPKLAGLLHDIGVYYFWQIAEWSDADVEKVDALLQSFKGRIVRDGWVRQARALSAETETRHEGGG